MEKIFDFIQEDSKRDVNTVIEERYGKVEGNSADELLNKNVSESKIIDNQIKVMKFNLLTSMIDAISEYEVDGDEVNSFVEDSIFNTLTSYGFIEEVSETGYINNRNNKNNKRR